MHHHNYIAAARKKGGLTQYDLAALLGVRQGTVSRYETGRLKPPLRIALGIYIVLGSKPEQCFPAVYDRILDRVMRMGAKLDLKLVGRTDPVSVKKRKTYAAMMKRARPTPAV
jgi:transcriptional regulator with XRE-family HTH domain